jgi:ribonuclease P protein component
MVRPDPEAPARFGRANRLVRGWQYQRAFREGKSERGECVVAYAHAVPGEPSRIGIIASKKVGNAVQRNRAKRRLREVARALWPRVPADGRQVVLIALSVVPTVDFGRLHDDVARLLRNLGVLDT